MMSLKLIFIVAFTFIKISHPFILTLKKPEQLLHLPINEVLIKGVLHSTSKGDEVQDEEETQYYSPNVELREREYLYDYEESQDGFIQTAQNENENNDFPSSVNEYSFFDEAVIFTRAGSGGQGSSTYKKGPNGQNAQPDGGDGGKGGDIILKLDDSLNTLAGLTQAWRPNSFGGGGAAAASSGNNQVTTFQPMRFRAENGVDGGRQFKNGRTGNSVVIRVPPGTLVQEEVDVYDEGAENKKVIRTNLVTIGSVAAKHGEQKLIVARGGSGGEGSGSQGFKKGRGVKRPRIPPVGGERKRLKLTLKIVADVALVGVPNSGKSTFLASVTRAKPKIANYPFTTVIPNLGVWVPPSNFGSEGMSKSEGSGAAGLALCDVPGLISGAAEGVGLGHAFLRHVERCHVILHLVDATSHDPINDFHMVNREILTYGNGKLIQKPQIVVVNKIDAWEDGSGEDWEKGLKTRMDRNSLELALTNAMSHSRLMWMSAKEKDGVDDLMKRMAGFVKKVKEVNP